ncbi:fused response regulator/phosphatase [Temperatibacter marinus]|uniref:Fused response regulator/phosphatase n=1 Tax=Temperatibacter marinus TaxID=1456591 RepID=A0AA52H937_9PROT|nr:fused response regulator/phosphatase [Temperatibacter marinus]WND02107.1 fused response regulator/phosphatase [Temperatibacter marinus]
MSVSSDHTLSELLGDVYSASILIVDDMLLMQKMIGQSLTNAGYNNLSYASDGLEAVEAIEKKCPDLVILDLNMPKMSGYDVCRHVRANPDYSGLPILVQSAAESPKERTEVFNVGGTDFVSKPINQPELLARVRMHLENKFLISNLTSFHDRVRMELEIAREMQQDILPSRAYLDTLSESCHVDIEAVYQSSSELGGDLWGIWPLEKGKFGFFVLDVSGHGVGSALNTFRAHSAMAIMEDLKEDPAAFLTELNSKMVSDFPTGSFATMFYAVVDPKEGQVTFAGAGAPNPFIISQDGASQRLDSSGYPIGIISSASYENLTASLKPGDLIFAYSDVFIEAPDDNGEFLGDAGLERVILDCHSQANDKNVIDIFIADFQKRVPGNLPDDLTAVGIYTG